LVASLFFRYFCATTAITRRYYSFLTGCIEIAGTNPGILFFSSPLFEKKKILRKLDDFIASENDNVYRQYGLELVNPVTNGLLEVWVFFFLVLVLDLFLLMFNCFLCFFPTVGVQNFEKESCGQLMFLYY
jgi:hypothetical protein